MAKVKYDKVDLEILAMDPIGRAYIEYNNKVGGEPIGETTGMPDLDIDKEYGGKVGLYNECIKQGKTWQELLGVTGNWDELEQ